MSFHHPRGQRNLQLDLTKIYDELKKRRKRYKKYSLLPYFALLAGFSLIIVAVVMFPIDSSGSPSNTVLFYALSLPGFSLIVSIIPLNNKTSSVDLLREEWWFLRLYPIISNFHSHLSDPTETRKRKQAIYQLRILTQRLDAGWTFDSRLAKLTLGPVELFKRSFMELVGRIALDGDEAIAQSLPFLEQFARFLGNKDAKLNELLDLNSALSRTLETVPKVKTSPEWSTRMLQGLAGGFSKMRRGSAGRIFGSVIVGYALPLAGSFVVTIFLREDFFRLLISNGPTIAIVGATLTAGLLAVPRK